MRRGTSRRTLGSRHDNSLPVPSLDLVFVRIGGQPYPSPPVRSSWSCPLWRIEVTHRRIDDDIV